MSWSDYDEVVATEWQRRRAAYSSAAKPIRVALVVSVVALLFALALPLSSVPAKVGLWLLCFSALFVADLALVYRQLRCPSCGKVPFLHGGLVSSTNPSRCYHCGKLLRAAQPSVPPDVPAAASRRQGRG